MVLIARSFAIIYANEHINGGPYEKYTAAISLVAPCENQQELDRTWDKLLQGGKAEQCGWLRDKYGIVWQVVPTVLLEMIADKNPAKAKAVTAAMMKMIKLNIAELKQAYDKA